MKKKVLVYYADTRGCGFYRVVLPYLELHRRGDFDVRICALTDPNDIMKADVVVFQRQHHDPSLTGVLTAKKFRKVIISENDDLLWALPYYNPGEEGGFIKDNKGNVKRISEFGEGSEKDRTLKKVYALSDALSLATPGLVRAHENDNPIRYCCPNFIPERAIRKAPQDEGHASLIWAGASGHDGDIEIVKKGLHRFLKDHADAVFNDVGYDYRLAFFGTFGSDRCRLHKSPWNSTDKFMYDYFFEKQGLTNLDRDQWKCLYDFDGWQDKGDQVLGIRYDGLRVYKQVEKMHWEVESYYDIMAQTGANIGIAPICSNVFNSGKSWNKILEYAMLGIPSIASNWGQYRDIVSLWDPYSAKRDKDAFAMAAEDPGSWYKSLVMLSSLKDLHDRMSRKALEWAKTKTIEKNAHIWTDMINELLEKKKGEMAA
jgi:hypothetical protein